MLSMEIDDRFTYSVGEILLSRRRQYTLLQSIFCSIKSPYTFIGKYMVFCLPQKYFINKLTKRNP